MADKKLVIFDFDGVLVNTSDLALALHAESNPHLPPEYFYKLSDGNFHENLERAIKEDGYIVQSDWYERYGVGLADLTTHDVIANLIRDLSAKYQLAIASSMQEPYIEKVLEREGIQSHFPDVLGEYAHKNKTLKIKGLLDKYSLSPDEAIFVTDTIGDIREGRAAGVQSIGVTWGNHSRERLQSESPYIIVDTVPELEAAIEKFFVIQ